MSWTRSAIAISLVTLAGCSLDSYQLEEPPPEQAWPNIACDPLVPSYCGYPFPSNVMTVEDPVQNIPPPKSDEFSIKVLLVISGEGPSQYIPPP